MLDQSLATYISALHHSGHKLVLEFAGAGSLALAALHSVAGSSRLLLEATDRYSSASMATLLGVMPERFVTRQTAEAMAERAYRRAMSLSDGTPGCLGVACTATIATDRVKRGEHGCWIAVRDAHSLTAYGLILAKGARDRLGEEQLVSRVLLQAIGLAANQPAIALDLQDDERLDRHQSPADDPIAELLAGTLQKILVDSDGNAQANPVFVGGILSGSFNPLHAGHELLAQAAAVALGQPVAFELPVINADKPPLGYAEVERRLSQFHQRYGLLLTRSPLFVQKAASFPGCVFVLGHDTASRLMEPRFYHGPAGVGEALDQLRAYGCRIMVAGRVRDGVFHTLDDINIPPAYADLFIELPEHLFRSDMSSSAIRRQNWT